MIILGKEIVIVNGNRLPTLLWISLKHNNNTKISIGHLNKICQVEVVQSINDIEQAISTFKPKVLCFDFDLPDENGYNALRETKLKYPSTPILVITEDNSAECAVLALRMRVWDYFIKPFAFEKFEKAVESLMMRPVDLQVRRQNLMSQPSFPEQLLQPKTKKNRLSSKMSLATTYIRQQLHRKLALEEVAEKCSMSKSHFGRNFKATLGVPFQEYLCQQRIERALALLKSSDLQVTEIALSVGFQELSNFSTTFQKHIGIRPSDFRKAIVSQKELGQESKKISSHLPSINPSPVLSFELNGRPQFMNPATLHLLKELNISNVKGILPRNHNELLDSCIKRSIPQTEKARFSDRTFIWSYHPILMVDIVFVYGHEITEYASINTGMENIPNINPNPVLTSDVNGDLQFVNPATRSLAKKCHQENVEGLLPGVHKRIVRECLELGSSITEKCVFSSQTIVWSYQPSNDPELIYIYGYCL